MDAVEEIKQRLSIEDVIAEYVQLKRAGRNFKGLSPFTNEKTASFMVSPEKQIWHDFSSGKGGNMFGFVMEVEGLDFKEALELLARKAGVDLQQNRPGDNGYSKKLKQRILQALELSTKFYQTQLSANKPAYSYVIKARGFGKQTLLTWKIGYAPNTGRALSNFLTKQGFTTEEMKRAGLVTQRRQGIGDMFRGRLMIPLCDAQGVVVGFTARLLADEPDAPKYINTPQTMVYDKSRQVFGLHLAKDAIRKEAFTVVVEGNMDVIASWQAGVTNVVATAGTAMTEPHLKMIGRFSGDVRLCFDADQAGLSATERTLPLAQKVNIKLSVVTLQGAKDPDELIKKDPKLWQQAIKDASYSVDWLISRYEALCDLKSATGKREFTDAILTTIRRLNDPVEQEHYIKHIAELTDTSFETIVAKLRQQPQSPQMLRKKTNISPSTIPKEEFELLRLQDHFLAMLLMRPSTRVLMTTIKSQLFSEGPRRELFDFLIENPDFKGDVKTAKKLSNISDYVKIVTLQFEEIYLSVEPDELLEQAARLRIRLVDKFVKTQKHRLAEEMKHVEKGPKLEKLIKQVNQLNKLIK